MTPGELAVVDGFARLSGVDKSSVRTLAGVLLADDVTTTKSLPSAMNNDGTALQACETCTSERSTFRLIGDPGARAPNAESRHAVSMAALERTLGRVEATAMMPLCRSTIDIVLPANPYEEPQLGVGTLWLAASPSSSGIALYVNARWGAENEQWKRAVRWLSAIQPSEEAADFARRAADQGRVASVALEGLNPEQARAKVYFRLAGRTPFAALDVPALLHPAMVEFLTLTVGQRSLARMGLIASAGFSTAHGSWSDTKLDICAHCLSYDTEAWKRLLRSSSRALGVVEPRSVDSLREGTSEVALAGCGVDREGRVRLNVYLKEKGSARRA